MEMAFTEHKQCECRYGLPSSSKSNPASSPPLWTKDALWASWLCWDPFLLSLH